MSVLCHKTTATRGQHSKKAKSWVGRRLLVRSATQRNGSVEIVGPFGPRLLRAGASQGRASGIGRFVRAPGGCGCSPTGLCELQGGWALAGGGSRCRRRG